MLFKYMGNTEEIIGIRSTHFIARDYKGDVHNIANEKVYAVPFFKRRDDKEIFFHLQRKGNKAHLALNDGTAICDPYHDVYVLNKILETEIRRLESRGLDERVSPLMRATSNRETVEYPCLVSPRLSGIRCSWHVQASRLNDQLGHYLSPPKDILRDLLQLRMSVVGLMRYGKFLIFEKVRGPSSIIRYNECNKRVKKLENIEMIPLVFINSDEELYKIWEHFKVIYPDLRGVVLKSLNYDYKFNRRSKDVVYMRNER